MAKRILIGRVTIAGLGVLWPGSEYDVTFEADTIAKIQAAGGVLYDDSQTPINEAAAQAQQIRLKGGSIEAAESLLQSAIQALQSVNIEDNNTQSVQGIATNGIAIDQLEIDVGQLQVDTADALKRVGDLEGNPVVRELPPAPGVPTYRLERGELRFEVAALDTAQPTEFVRALAIRRSVRIDIKSAICMATSGAYCYSFSTANVFFRDAGGVSARLGTSLGHTITVGNSFPNPKPMLTFDDPLPTNTTGVTITGHDIEATVWIIVYEVLIQL